MRELVHNLSSNERQLRQTRSLIFPCLSGPPFQFYIHKGILKEDWSTVLPMLSNPIFVCLFFYACTYIHTFHKISQLVVRAICEGPPTTYIQSADHMSRCACNLNRSSSVCGEEAGQGDEYICTWQNRVWGVLWRCGEAQASASLCMAQAGIVSSLHHNGWNTYLQPTFLGSQRHHHPDILAALADGRPSWTPTPESPLAFSHRSDWILQKCAHTCTDTYIHTYKVSSCEISGIHTYIHTYICVYIHMYIHTYKHTYIE